MIGRGKDRIGRDIKDRIGEVPHKDRIGKGEERIRRGKAEDTEGKGEDTSGFQLLGYGV